MNTWSPRCELAPKHSGSQGWNQDSSLDCLIPKSTLMTLHATGFPLQLSSWNSVLFSIPLPSIHTLSLVASSAQHSKWSMCVY